MRHRYGAQSQEAQDALKRLDGRVADIIQASKDAGIF